MIFYILSIKHNNKIALSVGWKICCLYLAVTFLRVRCALYGQCRFAVVAMVFKRYSFKFAKPVQKYHIVNKNWCRSYKIQLGCLTLKSQYVSFMSEIKYNTYLLTPSSTVLLEKLTSSAASQEIPRILSNPKVHQRTHNSPPTSCRSS